MCERRYLSDYLVFILSLGCLPLSFEGTLATDAGVNIPLNFELFNSATLFKGSSKTLCRNLYVGLPESERAQTCEQCGTCEQRCPQGIEIGNLMKQVAGHFS